MPLQFKNIAVGNLQDDVSGNNYSANKAVYILNLNNTLAQIFSDEAGAIPIVQDGVNNVTNSKGVFGFWVEAGDYFVQVGANKYRVSITGADYFNNRIDETVNLIVDAVAGRGAYYPVGSFEAGFTYTDINQVGTFGGTDYYAYTGGLTNLPHIVTAGTDPTLGGPYQQVTFPNVDAVNIDWDQYSTTSKIVAKGAVSGIANYRPSKLQNQSVTTETHRIVDYFDGLLYATSGGNLFESSNFGASYTQIVTGKSPIGIIPSNDGEVLLQFSNRIEKSSGWSVNKSTATFSTVLTLPTQATTTYFLRWGFDGDGQKFIATHYGDTGAIYRVWISTNAGSTFTLRYDQSAVTSDRSHMHAACYDAWDDRFYFNYGHGDPAGIYYSDNDGVSWTKMNQYSKEFDGVEATFTTMLATDFGIVCGTDRFPNGAYILRRSKNPDDIKLELACRWDSVRGGLLGFADRSFRDPDTGIVYISFRSDWQEVQPVIIAVGSEGGNVIYEAELDLVTPRRIQNVIAAESKLIAYINNPNETLKGDLIPYSTSDDANKGNLLTDLDAQWNSVAVGRGSNVTGSRSVGVGYDSEVITGGTAIDDAVAIGHASRCVGGNSVAIGSDTRATNQSVAIGSGVKTGSGETGTESQIVAIGYAASAANTNSTAVGGNAVCTNANSLAVGQNAQANAGDTTAVGRNAISGGQNSVTFGGNSSATSFGGSALGQGATATQAYSTSLGHSADATGLQSTSIGARSTASGNFCVAIGDEASATHNNAIAIGRQTSSQRDNSACFGDRDIESTKTAGGVILKSPNGTTYKITVDDAGVISATAV